MKKSCLPQSSEKILFSEECGAVKKTPHSDFLVTDL